MNAGKQFVLIGNMNAIKYKEVFPFIRDKKMWLGAGKNDGRNVWYQIPDDFEDFHKEENGKKYAFVAGTIWFTNLDHGKRHKPLSLMTEKDVIKFGTKNPFKVYDNFNAIEVPFVKFIPSDFEGIMGVPISFLSKHSPEQFEIVGLSMRDGFGLEDHKQYDSYMEIRQNGTYTGSSGRKTNGNPMIEGKPVKNNNYYIDEKGNCAFSLYDRIFIKKQMRVV